MKPILYEHDEVNFTSNGIGRLNPSRCIVTEERNGQFELEMDISIEDKHYADIQEGRILYAPHDETKRKQPFEIYMVSRPMGRVVTVNAHHISYRTAKITVMPCSAGSAPAALLALKNQSVTEHPFIFSTDLETEGSFHVDKPETLRSRLGGTEGSILDVYGGEYEWDKFTIYLRSARGSDTDVVLRYGKNITSLKKTTDSTNIWTGIVPYWYGINSESGEDDLVVLPEKAILADEDDSMLIPVDMSSYFSQKPTEEQLRTKARKYVRDNAPSAIPVSIDVSFVQLWQTQEYASVAPMERLRLCDTLTVKHEKLGVFNQAKVVKTVYNVLLERYDSMTVGTVLPSMGDAVRTMTEDIKKIIVPRTAMQAAIEHATQLIRGGLGGHVLINTNAAGEPNEILVMDTDDIDTAVNIMRINVNGIGFSTNGYNGPFRSAWTLDGHFVADFITTGNLNASLLTAGVITGANGHIVIDLVNDDVTFAVNSFKLVDANGDDTSITEQSLAGMSQTDVFNKLTDDGHGGHLDGIFMKDGQLYISLSYAEGGVLKLGTKPGSQTDSLNYGKLEVYNKDTSTPLVVIKSGDLDFYNFNGKRRLNLFGDTITGYNADGSTESFELKTSVSGNDVYLQARNNHTLHVNGGNNDLEILSGGGDVNITPGTNKKINLKGEVNSQYFIKTTRNVECDTLVCNSIQCSSPPWGSDIRLKKNIQAVKSQEENISRLNVYSFDWKKDGKHVGAGVIAQELQEIYPDLIGQNGDGYLTVDYVGLVPYLIKVIQEQQTEIIKIKEAVGL